MAEVIDSGGVISMALEPSSTIYVRRDKMIQSGGQIAVSVAAPSPHRAPMTRLLNKTFVMQKVTSGADGGWAVLTSPGGKQMIRISLSAEEKLAVSFSYLAGFSDRVRFASFANLSIAAFACDRNFTTIVSGPGAIVLETNGNHTFHTSSTVVFDPGQLVAWDPAICFRFDKVHGLVDLYLNRVRMSCTLASENLPLIVDSTPRNSSIPIVSYIKSVYLPKLY